MSFAVLRVLRLVRVFRIFKLSRLSFNDIFIEILYKTRIFGSEKYYRKHSTQFSMNYQFPRKIAMDYFHLNNPFFSTSKSE